MKKKFALLIALSGLLLFFDLLFGSAYLPFRTVWDTLAGNNANAVYHEIIFNHRLPKAFTAILTGAALSVAGVLMQTLFRNPLAGPDVLGVTSGASLGVALLTFCASSFPWLITTGWGQILAAVIGSLIVLSLIILASIQIPQTISLLIVGMMFGNFAGAIVSILQNSSNPDTLKLFVTWTFGSLSAVNWQYLQFMAPLILTGLAATFAMQKQLNLLLLGDNYAAGLGVSVSRTRIWAILSTALLAGTSTAFTGPIAFIGITVPHIARGIFRTSDHRTIIPAAILCGTTIMLACDIISQVAATQGILPINSITALFGSPIIIWIIMKGYR